MRWVLLGLFCATIEVLRCQYAGGGSEDDGDDNDCLPRLADDCFRYVSDNLHCHLNPNASAACEKKDVEDLCSAIDGGLQCARDIIDGDCSRKDGKDNFDLWMNGLEKMYRSLCSNNGQLLKVLIESSHCWNSGKFITCLEQEKHILHIVDFLKIKQDMNNCFHLIINVSSCSMKASAEIASCESPHNAITELLQTFFSAGICSGVNNGKSRKEPCLQFLMYLIICGFVSRLIPYNL